MSSSNPNIEAASTHSENKDPSDARPGASFAYYALPTYFALLLLVFVGLNIWDHRDQVRRDSLEASPENYRALAEALAACPAVASLIGSIMEDDVLTTGELKTLATATIDAASSFDRATAMKEARLLAGFTPRNAAALAQPCSNFYRRSHLDFGPPMYIFEAPGDRASINSSL